MIGVKTSALSMNPGAPASPPACCPWESRRRHAGAARVGLPSGSWSQMRARIGMEAAHELLFERADFGNSNVAFPLTPALSLGERENRSPVLRQSAVPLCSESGIMRLPLPKGEGRGEGNRVILFFLQLKIFKHRARVRLFLILHSAFLLLHFFKWSLHVFGTSRAAAPQRWF